MLRTIQCHQEVIEHRLRQLQNVNRLTDVDALAYRVFVPVVPELCWVPFLVQSVDNHLVLWLYIYIWYTYFVLP